MRASKWIVAATVMLAASGYAETKNEAWLGGGGFIPSGDFWEASRGGSMGWRYTADDVSFGLSIGVQTADVNDETLSGVDGFVTSSYLYGLRYAGYVDYYEGDATMVPISCLVSWNIPIDKLTLSLEAGLRYVFVNADVTAHMIDGLSYQGYVIDAKRWRSDTEIGNNFLGLIGANLQLSLSDNWSIFLNGGYQFDIATSDVEFKTHWTDYNGKSITESELGGFYALAGLTYKWASTASGKKYSPSSAISATSDRPVGISQSRDAKTIEYEKQLAEENRQAEIVRRAEELKQAEVMRKAEELRKAKELIKAEEQRKSEENRQAEETLNRKEKEPQEKPEPKKLPAENISKAKGASASSVSPADMTTAELMQSLDKLEALREEGILSAEEYELQHSELLKYYLGIKN